jgi:hypothetical protein
MRTRATTKPKRTDQGDTTLDRMRFGFVVQRSAQTRPSGFVGTAFSVAGVARLEARNGASLTTHSSERPAAVAECER